MPPAAYSNGTPVTCSMVQTEVQNYLQAAGFSSSVATKRLGHGHQSQQRPLDRPGSALPLDPFSVTVTVSGTAFSSLTWVSTPVTGMTQASATVEWLSNNDQQVTVSTQIPYGQNFY